MRYAIALIDASGNPTETIEFDAVTKFDEDYGSSVPQYAVEGGYNISDSISNNNPRYSLSAVVIDTQFGKQDGVITYDGTQFRRKYTSTSNIDGKISKITKDRLLAIRSNKEVFGVFITDYKTDDIRASQVDLIYPCAMTGIQFSDSDGANAIYPSITFEKISVAYVEIKYINNPTPKLIPYVRHGDSTDMGNATSSSGSVEIDKDLADQKKVAKDLSKDVVKTDPTNKYDAKVEATRKEVDYTKFLQKEEANRRAEIRAGGSYGDSPYGGGAAATSARNADAEMVKKYGPNWKQGTSIK